MIEFEKEEAHEIGYGVAPEGFSFVTEQNEGSGRWQEYILVVIRRDSDDQLFGAIHERGLTEYQDGEEPPTTYYEVTETTKPYYVIED